MLSKYGVFLLFVFFFNLMPCGFISQMSLLSYWATWPMYHRRLQATNTPPQNNRMSQQTCKGRILETLSTKVRDRSTRDEFPPRPPTLWTHKVILSQTLCLPAVPLINSKFIRGVLPDCLYKPTYTIKDFPLLRYQGLQFVRIHFALISPGHAQFLIISYLLLSFSTPLSLSTEVS